MVMGRAIAAATSTATARKANRFMRSSLSAADLAHRAAGPDKAGVVDSGLELLVCQRVAIRFLELGIAGAVAQRRLQIPFGAREQRGAKPTVGREPDAVAA